jgi:Tfp pilus assembly protein PilF
MRNLQSTGVWLLVGCATFGAGCARTQEYVRYNNPITKPAQDRSIKYDLAQVAEREGNLRKAEQNYRDLLKDKPTDPRYSHRLGIVQIRLGEREEGIALLEKAAELKPNDAAILNDLGFAQLEGGEIEQAERNFRAALAVRANDPRTINNLGMCAGLDGRLDEAYGYFRRVGSEAQAQANLGYVLAQSGDVNAAMERYNRALSHDPEMKTAAEALIQLASLSKAAEESDLRFAQQAQEVEEAEESEEFAEPAPAPVIRQASATKPASTKKPAPAKPAAAKPVAAKPAAQAAKTAASTLGLSTADETQFYAPVIADEE